MDQTRRIIQAPANPTRSEKDERLGSAETMPACDSSRADRTQMAISHPPIKSRQALPADAEMVIARLEEAGQTLLCLPNTGHSTNMRQTRHKYVSEAVDAYNAESGGRPKYATPDAGRITRMDQALAWIPLIPGEQTVLRRIVGCRSLVSPLTERHLFTWRRLARLLSADHKAVQRWHAVGIDTIVASLKTH